MKKWWLKIASGGNMMLTNMVVTLIMEDCVALNLTLDYDIEQKT